MGDYKAPMLVLTHSHSGRRLCSLHHAPGRNRTANTNFHTVCCRSRNLFQARHLSNHAQHRSSLCRDRTRFCWVSTCRAKRRGSSQRGLWRGKPGDEDAEYSSNEIPYRFNHERVHRNGDSDLAGARQTRCARSSLYLFFQLSICLAGDHSSSSLDPHIWDPGLLLFPRLGVLPSHSNVTLRYNCALH